jgi:predicted MFS family arabinose efflux permease
VTWLKISSQKRPNSGILVFVSLTVLYFCSIFHRVGIAAVAPDLQTDFTTNASILGLMSGMYFYAYALAQIPAGIAADKYGVRKTITIFGLAACLGNLLFALSPSIEVLSIGRAIIGFGVGGFYVCALKALAINYPRRRYATNVGVLTSLGNIGAIVASSPLALLSLAIGWRDSFQIILLVMLGFVGIVWFFMNDPLEKAVSRKRSILADLKTVFSNKELRKLMPVPFFVYGFFVAFQGLWVGPFLMQVYGMSKSGASYFFAFIGFVVAFPLAGIISDRIKRRKPVLIVGVLLSLAFWLMMTLFGGSLSEYQIVALFLFLGLSFGVADIFLTIPVNLCSVEISGLAIGSLNIFNFAGGGFFQFFMGVLLDSTKQLSGPLLSYQLIFGIGVLCIMISLISALRLDERVCG